MSLEKIFRARMVYDKNVHQIVSVMIDNVEKRLLLIFCILSDSFIAIVIFLICYLTAPRPILEHNWGVNYTISSRSHLDPRSKVGSLSPAERLVGFEPGTFRLYHNALTYYATLL